MRLVSAASITGKGNGIVLMSHNDMKLVSAANSQGEGEENSSVTQS